MYSDSYTYQKANVWRGKQEGGIHFKFNEDMNKVKLIKYREYFFFLRVREQRNRLANQSYV